MSAKTQVKMVITEALSERKLLRKRISKAITAGRYFGVVIGKDAKPHNPAFKTAKEEAEHIQSTFDQVTSLQRKYYALVGAVAVSNANTEIEVAGQKMTVASAIEYKKSIDMERNLVNELTRQLADSSSTIRTLNTRAQSEIQDKLKALHGTAESAKISEDDFNAIHDPHMNRYGPELHDPMKLVEWVTEKSNRLDEFQTAIENALNVKNAVTEITFEY